MKFCKWVHPKTGAVRVYVNGVDSRVSVFVVNGGASGKYPDGFPEIVVKGKDGVWLNQSDIDSIMDEIDEHVKVARPPEVNPIFADYLALAV